MENGPTKEPDGRDLVPQEEDALARDEREGDVEEGVKPDEERDTTLLEVHKMTAVHGPIPPPQMLAEYEQAFEGGARWFFTQAAEEAKHRRQLEKEESERLTMAVQADYGKIFVGQILAFVLAIATIIGGIYLIATGHDIGGLVAVIGALATLAGVFIYRTRLEMSQERVRTDESA